MKKVMIIILSMFSMDISADWLSLGDDAASEYTIYYDQQSIQIEGNKVIVWFLLDYKRIQKSGELSIIAKEEFACKDRNAKTLFVTVYSKNMGSGELIGSQDHMQNDILKVIPGTVIGAKYKVACGKQ